MNKSKLIGAHIPEPQFRYLSLYAAFVNKSKSAILREAVTKWISDKPVTAQTMSEALIQNVQSNWYEEKYIPEYRSEKPEDLDNRFAQFIMNTEAHLRLDGISNDLIASILNRIQK